jgi:multiple sugar transport system ATP-binding protein
MLMLDHLSKAYGRSAVRAVKDLTLRIDDGEFIALLGSSGCGKTSTLRMIAGFEAVTEGSISLSGRRIDGLPPAQRHVAMAFEGYALYPPLTVEDNIGFGLASKPGFDPRQRVRELADLLEIGAILKRKPAGLSGGQQQRASLARALARDAELHLLDEPPRPVASPPSSSPMTRPRRTPWLTASPSWKAACCNNTGRRRNCASNRPISSSRRFSASRR